MLNKLGWPMATVSIIGIGGIVALEAVAIAKGIDGTLLAVTIAIIGSIVAGLAGFKIGKGGKQ